MKLTTKQFVKAAMMPFVPQALLKSTFPKDAVAFCYHVVSDTPLDAMRYYEFKNEAQFAADVRYVAQTTGAIGYDELRRSRLEGKSCPPNNRALITFDDGFRCCYETVRPILLEAGVPAVFFVLGNCIDNQTMFFESKVSLCITAVESLTTENAHELLSEITGATARPEANLTDDMDDLRLRLLDRFASVLPSESHKKIVAILLSYEQEDEQAVERVCQLVKINPAAYLAEHPVYLSTAEIAQLAADGFTIGSHGWNHRRAQHMAPDELEHEIVSSCQRIREMTGQEQVPYSFPYGGTGIDRNFLREVRSRHPCVDLIFDTAEMTRDEPFIVNRVWGDPPPSEPHGSNLAALQKKAWMNRSAWWRS